VGERETALFRFAIEEIRAPEKPLKQINRAHRTPRCFTRAAPTILMSAEPQIDGGSVRDQARCADP